MHLRLQDERINVRAFWKHGARNHGALAVGLGKTHRMAPRFGITLKHLASLKLTYIRGAVHEREINAVSTTGFRFPRAL